MNYHRTYDYNRSYYLYITNMTHRNIIIKKKIATQRKIQLYHDMELHLSLYCLFFLLLCNGIATSSAPNDGYSFPCVLDKIVLQIGSIHGHNTTRESIHDHTQLYITQRTTIYYIESGKIGIKSTHLTLHQNKLITCGMN